MLWKALGSKNLEKIDQSQVVIYLFDSSSAMAELERIQIEIEKLKNKHPLKPLIVLANKADKLSQDDKKLLETRQRFVIIC